MSKITRWKCDECGEAFDDDEGGIHIREMTQDYKGREIGMRDGNFDFCKKDCLLDFFAKYQFR